MEVAPIMRSRREGVPPAERREKRTSQLFANSSVHLITRLIHRLSNPHWQHTHCIRQESAPPRALDEQGHRLSRQGLPCGAGGEGGEHHDDGGTWLASFGKGRRAAAESRPRPRPSIWMAYSVIHDKQLQVEM